MKPWILGVALLTACGTSPSVEADQALDASTGHSPVAETPGTSTSFDGSSGSSGSDASTGEVGETTGEVGETTGEVGETTTGDGEPPNLDPGPTACTETACTISCEHPKYQLDDGAVCECMLADTPQGLLECELPLPCSASNDPLQCIAQGLRYNIAGAYEYDSLDGDDYHLVRYEVFGPGLVRWSSTSRIRGCCSGSVSSFASYRVPQSTTTPKDPFWDDCKAEIGGSCFDEALLFPEDLCRSMLKSCPELVELGESCEESCPMAADGICDEEAGTGLCAAGCDPHDCS